MWFVHGNTENLVNVNTESARRCPNKILIQFTFQITLRASATFQEVIDPQLQLRIYTQKPHLNKKQH